MSLQYEKKQQKPNTLQFKLQPGRRAKTGQSSTYSPYSPYRPTEPSPLMGHYSQTGNRAAQGLANPYVIPEPIKTKMENAFQTDFSDVTITPHSSRAPQLGALAYTQGNNIHFAPGRYNPHTSAGQRLLGHELTHVVQQRQGRVPSTMQMAGLNINDNAGLEKEADSMGNNLLQGKTHRGNLEPRQPSGNIIQLARAGNNIVASIDKTNSEMEGFGYELSSNPGKNFKTQVKWNPTQKVNTCDDGDGMTASVLGPEHPQGSGPSGSARDATDWARIEHPGLDYIAGHLLNDNLGGTGADAKNLTAIPSHVNKEHSKKVEEPIKAAVNDFGNWVFYEAKVPSRDMDNLATSLEFKWGYLNNDGTRQKTETCTLSWNNSSFTGVAVTGKFTMPTGPQTGAAASDIGLKKQFIPLTNKNEDYPGSDPRPVKEFPVGVHHIGSERVLFGEVDKIKAALTKRFESLLKAADFDMAKKPEESKYPSVKGRGAKDKWREDEISRLCTFDEKLNTAVNSPVTKGTKRTAGAAGGTGSKKAKVSS